MRLQPVNYTTSGTPFTVRVRLADGGVAVVTGGVNLRLGDDGGTEVRLDDGVTWKRAAV